MILAGPRTQAREKRAVSPGRLLVGAALLFYVRVSSLIGTVPNAASLLWAWRVECEDFGL